MDKKERLGLLETNIRSLYRNQGKELLFHGWHHILFVKNKGGQFARITGADDFLVESASLVHDLNYFVTEENELEAGTEIRQAQLTTAGYSDEEIQRIESIVSEAHTSTRGETISEEGKALSDGDTLFKSLPITPILFTSKYIQETKKDVGKLAASICSKQNPLMEKGIYFYTEHAKKTYTQWAETNLKLWNNVRECLTDKDVKEMLEIAEFFHAV